MVEAEKAKGNGTEIAKRWWAMTTTQKRPIPDPTRMVTVSELPMYAEDVPVQYSFIPDEPLPLQSTISKVRKAVVHKYDAFAVRFLKKISFITSLSIQRFQLVDRTVKNTAKAACGWPFCFVLCHANCFLNSVFHIWIFCSGLSQHLSEERTILPKAAAITVGGMAGFVFSMKKSGFHRLLYPTIGLVTMAAFCYPHETVAIIRTGIAHTKSTWYSFKECKFFFFVMDPPFGQCLALCD
ncbi:unnamed protein product [Toxocara canis]|uniref:MICOS complex subunit n=1 Tax=Toxocara canis TaxID=6265 RepID=A0A183UKJ1_TOXCA|nr:unnamed protein product [Toxocara canis]